MKRGFFSFLFLTLIMCGCERSTENPDGAKKSFLERREHFQTHLLRHGPSPQPYREESPPQGITEITYPTVVGNLKGWLYRPANADSRTNLPVLVYFHGGFAFGKDDMLVCRPFAQAGFMVFAPMLRGENGNPGDFEMFFGEVEDARSALRWIANHPGVDHQHIYTFGHSAGGVISALLSLYGDGFARLTGSSGGLYGPSSFRSDPKTPFDLRDPQEAELRCLVGHSREMKVRHAAYVGDGDPYQQIKRLRAEAPAGSLLSITVLHGDHFSVLEESFRQYLKRVQEDLQL